jgi:hypothetical protein
VANEIRGVAPSGSAPKVRIANKAGLWWNGSTFEAYASADYPTYLVALTEQGASGVFMADFPSGITTPGTYEYYVHLDGTEGAQVVSTGKVDWTGSSAAAGAAGSMSGSDFRDYVVSSRGFKRDDKDSELYDAITDAIQIMRRRCGFDEAEVEASSTDTIDTLGQWQLDVESDLGLLLGVVVEDGNTAQPLTRLSKDEFDRRYPYNRVDSSARSFPVSYCVYAGQIQLGPIPNKTSYVYRLAYSKRAGVVTSSTASVPFTNLYRDILADLVMSRLYVMLEEYDKAAGFKQSFEAEFDLAVRRERINSAQTTFTMVPID